MSEPQAEDGLRGAELLDAWTVLSSNERREGFQLLPRSEQEELFLNLKTGDQTDLLSRMTPAETRSWIRLLAPHDAADILQQCTVDLRPQLLEQLDEPARYEVRALLAYEEDRAGGLMNPRFVRVRPDMTVDEAFTYLRKQAERRSKMLHYAYVLDDEQRLLGVVSFRDLFLAQGSDKIATVMHTSLVTVTDDMSQGTVSQVFTRRALLALPVVDHEGRMKGVITADDIVDVVQEEATKELHKFAAVEAFQEPFLSIGLSMLFKRRGVWLAALFLGEMLTATAMGHYEGEISKAVVLALFIPLIISSGGNSGSQASTLVVRAMALGQVRLRDWWRVLYRELALGIALGALLGSIGLLRILLWPARRTLYGEHFAMVAITVACSLIGVVLFGSLVGAMLPFILRRLRLDPATACAPFVATLVDVSGLVIYFTVASFILHGTLL